MALDWTRIGVDLAAPAIPPEISQAELEARWAAVQAAMVERDLDALVVVGDEAEFSSLRYLSDYWPLFERGAIVFAPSGDPTLVSGPECETYATLRGRVERVRLVRALRESADPSYPEVEVTGFDAVFAELGVPEPRRVGIAGSFAANLVVMDELRAAVPAAELVRADAIVTDLRAVKSDWELDCLRAASAITEIAIDAVFDRIRPGMTELQVVGIAQAAMYANGAEYEGMPQYVLSAENSRAAINRPGHRVIGRGEMVQLNLSARVHGYSSGIGRPVVLGAPSPGQRDLIEFCRDAHRATREWVRAGVDAASVARRYVAYFADHGRADALLYGPCTGLGLMETEQPWIETDSDYVIRPRTAYQLDTFAQGPEIGVRWENGAIVHEDGLEMLADNRMDDYVIA